MEQVLVNLAGNARDAMPQGGTLTIETRAVELDDDYIFLHPDVRPGHYVELAVSDTGTGMSKDVIEHIFEPFFTTRPTGDGTGLGLAIVYGIVIAAEGTMNVYSEEGIGTTFRVYFPASETRVLATPTATTSIPRGHGESILVSDDEPGVLELTSRILRNNGYTVLGAPTAEEAMSLAATQAFQLLITDSVMPQVSGRTLAEQINELQPGLAVLHMSGYSPAVISPPGSRQHRVGFLQKPFNQRALLESVHATLAP